VLDNTPFIWYNNAKALLKLLKGAASLQLCLNKAKALLKLLQGAASLQLCLNNLNRLEHGA
jgi:hypothetical protein